MIAVARILVFEDDAELIEALTESLEFVGHEVVSSLDADEAFALIRDRQVNLAVVDVFIRRDESNVADGGILLLTRLKSARASGRIPNVPHVPIIMMSGRLRVTGDDDIKKYAASFGTDTFLPKPFGPTVLLTEVERLLDMQTEPSQAV